jgi:hypothetical protein
MMKVPDETGTWRKASFSGPDTDCVEVRQDLAAIRDSKNSDGPILAARFAGLVAAVKADRLAR